MDAPNSTRLLAALLVAMGILSFVDTAFANTWELPAAAGFLFILAGWFVDSGPFPLGAGLGFLAVVAAVITFFDWDKNSNGDWALATATLVMAGLSLAGIALAVNKRRGAGIVETDTAATA